MAQAFQGRPENGNAKEMVYIASNLTTAIVFVLQLLGPKGLKECWRMICKGYHFKRNIYGRVS